MNGDAFVIPPPPTDPYDIKVEDLGDGEMRVSFRLPASKEEQKAAFVRALAEYGISRGAAEAFAEDNHEAVLMKFEIPAGEAEKPFIANCKPYNGKPITPEEGARPHDSDGPTD